MYGINGSRVAFFTLSLSLPPSIQFALADLCTSQIYTKALTVEILNTDNFKN
jgi:hypothetical protein